MNENLELQFSLTKDDLIDFQEFREANIPHKNFDPLILRSVPGVGLMVFVFCLFIAKPPILESIGYSLILVLLTIFASILFSYGLRRFTQRISKYGFRDLPDIDEAETTYTLSKRFLTISDGFKEEVISWYSFQSVAEYPKGYVFLSHEDHIEVIVPKRIFPDYPTERKFRNLIDEVPGLNF